MALRPDLQTLANLVLHEEKVLDLGCGDGSLLYYLQSEKDVIARGVELHEFGVLSCIEKGLSVRQGNLHEGLDDYPDQSFDLVILSHTLPYINDPARTLREMLRVGKRAIVTFPNFGYWRYRLELLILGRMPNPPELPSPWEKGPRPRPMTLYDFEFLCAREGIPINTVIHLYHGRRIEPRWGQNLRASAVIFELR